MVNEGRIPRTYPPQRSNERNDRDKKNEKGGEGKLRNLGGGAARVGLGSWRGKGPPSRRSVAGLKERTVPLAMRKS
jgi:hypothetical protein